MRLLDRSEVVLDLNRLGLEPKQLEIIRKGINAPMV